MQNSLEEEDANENVESLEISDGEPNKGKVNDLVRLRFSSSVCMSYKSPKITLPEPQPCSLYHTTRSSQKLFHAPQVYKNSLLFGERKANLKVLRCFLEKSVSKFMRLSYLIFLHLHNNSYKALAKFCLLQVLILDSLTCTLAFECLTDENRLMILVPSKYLSVLGCV